MADRSFPDHNGGLSFGRYLKAVRKSLGISLESVASEIRVSPGLLTWIEAEDYDRMPEEVYTRGVLRAYARVLDVDPDDILDRYRISRAAHEASARQEAEILTSGRHTFFRMSLALGVLALIIGLSLNFYGSRDPGPKKTPAAAEAGRQSAGEMKTRPQEEAPLLPGEPFQSGGTSEALLKENMDAGRLTVSIDAVSEVTVNIRVDDEPYTKYHLDPNDHMELAARTGFHILISDAAGVRLRFNGEPVKISAEPGHSANLILPKRSGDR